MTPSFTLDLAPLRAAPVSPSIAPATLLREVAARHAAVARSRGIMLIVTASPDLPGLAVDAESLARALGALVAYALSATAAGGCVALRATTVEDRRARRPQVTITVTHTPGAQGAAGAQLGAMQPDVLAAWLLVEDVGGAIGTTRGADGGDAFWVTLPALA